MKTAFIVLAFLFLISCQSSLPFKKGEYGYDLEFLQKHQKIIELVNENSRLIIAPQYQGRVMTSTSGGLKGYSFGWINHDLIASKKILEHFNPFGGEERLWLGPEGGQFSLFFPKDSSFSGPNWYVPKEMDSEAFNIEKQDSNKAILSREFELKNYSGTSFKIKVTLNIKLLNDNTIDQLLGIKNTSSVHRIAYQSENVLKNTGPSIWTKEKGALSIWLLSMLNASPDVTVILPYKKEAKGRIVKDDYFSKVPENRLTIKENAAYFLTDGNYRSKIGISPSRVIPRIGSYDAKNKKLTILEFSFSEKDTAYVNNSLEIQKDPFAGDVINVYNDGPKDNNPGMGKYYELETASPAAFLKPGEEITHTQRTYHFEGNEKELNVLAKSLLNVSLTEVTDLFKLYGLSTISSN
jgi:hypothetical protein